MHSELSRVKLRTIQFSMTASATLMAVKVTVGFFSGSVGILAEAGNSFLDFIASLSTLLILRVADSPADKEHAYGHGKLENLASLMQAGLILLTGLGILVKSVAAFLDVNHKVEHLGPGIGVMIFGTLVSWMVSARIRKAAMDTDSTALMGDSTHFAADVVSNLGVLIALILVHFTGWQRLDPVIGFAVGLVILHSAVPLVRTSFADLIDTELAPELIDKIKAIVESHRDMIIDYHNLRTRRSGSHKLIDLHVTTCRVKTLEEAHLLIDHIENEIQNAIPHSNVLIHTDPCLPSQCATGSDCRLAGVHFHKHVETQNLGRVGMDTDRLPRN